MSDISIEELDGYFAKMLEKVPEVRREMLEELAGELLGNLHRRIGGAGKVQSWQEKYVGSGGGYAAVRPKAGTFTAANRRGNRYSVRKVTGAITVGHKTPGGGYISGKHFYADTREDGEKLARRAMEKFEKRLREEWK